MQDIKEHRLQSCWGRTDCQKDVKQLEKSPDGSMGSRLAPTGVEMMMMINVF